MTGSADPILIGELSGVYGVKGWVKVFSYTQPKENILVYKHWLLRIEKQWKTTKVVSAKQHGKGIIGQLEGCEDRDKAASLMGVEVAISAEQLAKLPENEFYWAQLIGLQVVTTTGQALGKVVRMIETGANDVLVTDEDCMIPFARPEIVKLVDLVESQITVDWVNEYI